MLFHSETFALYQLFKSIKTASSAESESSLPIVLSDLDLLQPSFSLGVDANTTSAPTSFFQEWKFYK